MFNHDMQFLATSNINIDNGSPVGDWYYHYLATFLL